MNEAMNLRVRVKPVFFQLIHSGPYEGPCRVGTKELLSPEAERKRGRSAFKRFCDELESRLTKEAEILKPEYIEWGDDWVIPEEALSRLDAEAHKVDLFLVSHLGGLSQYPAITLAHRYRRPVAMIGQVMNVDISAYLRARGMEGYAPLDLEELNHLISLLRVRKAVRSSRILIVTEGGLVPLGVVSSVWDPEIARRRLGVDYRCVPFEEVLREMDRLARSEEGRRDADRIVDRLVKNAKEVSMRREYILRSVMFYLAAKSLMRRYGCNAFLIPCFEICATRIPEERKLTFCLTHTLLKDEGYPSACEGDLNVLLAMMILMYLSRKSAYMGNSYIVDKSENIMALHHDVPGIKMKGLSGPDLPYEIRSFTVGGWGATIRYDFSMDKGETVTMARFDPTVSRLLVVRGEIVGSAGVKEVGCSLRAYIKVRDVVDLFHKEADFGHHLAMVYGDYTRELRELADLMGFKVVEA